MGAGSPDKHHDLSAQMDVPYLSDRLHRANVGVRPKQDMLQLGLLLIDPLHRQPLPIFLGLTERLILKQTLKKTKRNWNRDIEDVGQKTIGYITANGPAIFLLQVHLTYFHFWVEGNTWVDYSWNFVTFSFMAKKTPAKCRDSGTCIQNLLNSFSTTLTGY